MKKGKFVSCIFFRKKKFYSELYISYAINQNLLQIQDLAYKSKLLKSS